MNQYHVPSVQLEQNRSTLTRQDVAREKKRQGQLGQSGKESGSFHLITAVLHVGVALSYVPVTVRGDLSLTSGPRVSVKEGTTEQTGCETAIIGETKIDPNWMLTRSRC